MSTAPASLSRAPTAKPKNLPGWIGLWRFIESPISRVAQRRLNSLRRFIFVCYARRDEPRIKPVLACASAEGHVFWIDQFELEAGRRWSADIVAAIRASRAVIVFCSANAFASDDVFREVATAGRFDKPIVPVVLDDAAMPDEFLYYLSIHQAIKVSDPKWREKFLAALGNLQPGQRRPMRTRRADAAQAPQGAR